MSLVRALVLFTLLLLLAACNGSPTEPHGGMPSLAIGCHGDGSNVVCDASAANVGKVVYGDVTRSATWFSSGASGSFPQPGLFAPSGSGEVEIWAKFDWKESETRSMWLVAPNAPARRLQFVGGNIKDATTNEKLTGATVRVLDGYAAGRSATSNSLGYYSIRPVLTGETFTLEASMPGYATKTLTFRVEFPGTPFLDIAMERWTVGG